MHFHVVLRLNFDTIPKFTTSTLYSKQTEFRNHEQTRPRSSNATSTTVLVRLCVSVASSTFLADTDTARGPDKAEVGLAERLRTPALSAHSQHSFYA